MEESAPPERKCSFRSYAVGAAASFLSTLATFPIYKTVFRQQLHACSITEAVCQLSKEGLPRFYRGVFPPLLAKTLQGTVLFGTHDSFLRILSSQSTGPFSLGERARAGLLSGFLEALVFGPLERVQNVLQDGQKNKRFPTTGSILKEFSSYAGREKLTLGYCRGLGLIAIRNCLGSCLYFSFKDPLRDSLLEKGVPSRLPALVSGSLNGALVSLLLSPLSVLIVNVQSQVGKRETLHLQAAVAAVWRTRSRKAILLYRGASLLVLRSGLTWGLTTALHDFLLEVVG
ncbi:solute carrier family 25 member 53 [Varanus komodoensis]|uniref:solute carrier family 25 member 53 n=1 Tax=Varanus komodoensis TaxID=61221 RepID=UPI001CF79090|nr:solute carrier family 25 member 53 [Varanus komodoensis]